MEKKKRPDKSAAAVILMAAAGIILLVFSGFAGEKENANTYQEAGFYTEYLENRIAGLCNSVEGVADAAVFLTMDCSSEYVYSRENGSDFLILTGNNGEEAVLLQEIYPRVRGIAVVCAGGDVPRVREVLTEILSAALDLPSHKIRIAGGAKN